MTCPGLIGRVRPQIDPATRTATLEIVPDRQCGSRLLPGMLVRATLTLARRPDVIAVPAEAVVTRPDGGRSLFVVAGETAEQRAVKVGLEGAGWIEIVEGIADGELIIVQGQERLKSGAAVAVRGARKAAGGSGPTPASAKGGPGADAPSDGNGAR
jgi:membrane fusion protein, multidrug efflux system